MAKKNRRSKGPGLSTENIGLTGSYKTRGTLVDRAVEIKMLYKMLRDKAPRDNYGTQKAFVDVGDDEAAVTMPTKAQLSSSFSAYGLTSVATTNKPFQLIPKISPEDVLYNVPKKEQPSVLRQLLRKIVDEV